MDIWNLVTNTATLEFGTLSKNTLLGSIIVQLQESYKVSDMQIMLITNKLFTIIPNVTNYFQKKKICLFQL